MTKATIPISPSAEVQEARVLIEHYRNRNLILSQALEDKVGLIDERDRRISELEASLALAASEPPETATGTGTDQSTSEEQVH